MTSNPLKDLYIRDVVQETSQVDAQARISKALGKILEIDGYQVFTILSSGRIASISLREILAATDIIGQKVSSIALQVPALKLDDKLSKAVKLISENRVRALPVIKGSRLIGEVNVQTLLRVVSLDSRLTVGRIMTPNPYTMWGSEPASTARRLMVDLQVDHLPIVDGSKVGLLLTSKDLASAMVPPSSPGSSPTKELIKRFEYPVRSLASDIRLVVDPSEAAPNVLHKMFDAGSSYSLVLLGEELQGIVTYRDFLRPLYKPMKKTALAYIAGLPEDLFEREAVRSKFVRAIEFLNKGLPDLLEARAVIKSSKKGRGRSRYKVVITVRTSNNVQTFREAGWDILEIFDILASKIKRILSDK